MAARMIGWRRPYLTFVGAIDDATGKVPYGLFRDEEDVQWYILLLRHIVEKQGIPEVLCHMGMAYLSAAKKNLNR